MTKVDGWHSTLAKDSGDSTNKMHIANGASLWYQYRRRSKESSDLSTHEKNNFNHWDMPLMLSYLKTLYKTMSFKDALPGLPSNFRDKNPWLFRDRITKIHVLEIREKWKWSVIQYSESVWITTLRSFPCLKLRHKIKIQVAWHNSLRSLCQKHLLLNTLSLPVWCLIGQLVSYSFSLIKL